MRYGYPKRTPLQKFIDECKCIETKFNKMGLNRSEFYTKVLLAIGFKFEDFKMTNNTIFFRLNKFQMLEKFYFDLTESKEDKTESEASNSKHKSKPK